MRTHLFLTALLCTGALAAEIDWPSIKLTRLSGNPLAPVQITHAGDGSGRLFIVDRSGIIWLHSGGQLLRERFLSIEDRVLGSFDRGVSEQGLLGLAFPPDFRSKQYFYVHYTRRFDGTIIISRFFVSTGKTNSANAASEEILLTIPHPLPAHNGGQLAFGPDGFLYIGTGDGGGFGDATKVAQAPDSLLGKMLRIDVESGVKPYGIPADNPFVNTPGHRPEIWAVGLRNPWRFSFDRVTGDLYIGDVGERKREEISFQSRASRGGENYGWPVKEGTLDFKAIPGIDPEALVAPIVEYGREEGISVTGGFVYRGTNSLRMRGVYIYGDFGSGRIWGLQQAEGRWVNQQIAGTPHRICSFGEDEAGELYLVDYRGGQVYRIEDSGTVVPPFFSPPAGMNSTDQVTLTTGTPRARIHYTTDGREPTEADPSLNSGESITIVTDTTLKARAYRSDLAPSEITGGTFVLQVAIPSISPASGTQIVSTNNLTISISCPTPQTIIRYTLDGTLPSPTSTIYSGPFVVQGDTRVSAQAYRNGFRDSVVEFATYPFATAATPILDPPSGFILKGTQVVIRSSASGAVIRYTLDGSIPTLQSTVYSGPIVFTQPWTILQAVAFQEGYKPSTMAFGHYQWEAVATPLITPASGGITNGTQVTLVCPTPGAIIRYTLNGEQPTATSTTYTGPFQVVPPVTVNAKAFKDGFADSVTAGRFYSSATVYSPEFSPSGGPLTNKAVVSITVAPPDAVIYYTLDGSEPTELSSRYSGPIAVTPPMTLKAKGTKPGYIDGPVSSAFYGLVIYEDTDVSTLAGSTNYFGEPGFSDGRGASARFFLPNSIVFGPTGALFVVDMVNNRIRKISLDGMVTTYAGTGVAGFRDGPAMAAQFNRPQAIAADASGNLFVVDASNYRIRKINPAQEVSTIAGDGWVGVKDGPALEAQFVNPRRIAIDSQFNLFILDIMIRKLSPAGAVTTLPSGTFLFEEIGIDSLDNIVAAGSSKLWKSTGIGTFSKYAGTSSAFSDGTNSSAAFLGSFGGIAVDRLNNVYLSDQLRVRKVRTNGVVTTLAGNGRRGNKDGGGSLAEFTSVQGLCVDDVGTVYLADGGSHTIRRIVQKDWDEDGIPDFLEGGETPFIVGVDDRRVDTDRDGVSNADEFAAGTDPTGQAELNIRGVTISPDGRITVSWHSAAGFLYQLQASENLVIWSDVGPSIAGNGELLSTKEPQDSADAPARFYRLRGQLLKIP